MWSGEIPVYKIDICGVVGETSALCWLVFGSNPSTSVRVERYYMWIVAGVAR